jgi:hypothetical protein
MKKILFSLLVVTVLFSSCAVHYGNSSASTQVQLTKKNFKVVEAVQGEATATYIFSIGGLAKKALIAEARNKMIANANLIGSSRAIINETIEVKQSLWLPGIYQTQTVIVSGHIIEFTE